MDQPTFLDRRPLGIPNYLAIAVAVVMVMAVIPRGSRKALESNTNKVEDWLPASYIESTELEWFRNQFGNEAFVVVSWGGCTLSDTSKLELLAARLRKESLTPQLAELAGVKPHADRRIFTRVKTGPELIDQLTAAPAKLERSAAIERLEGAMIGLPAVEGDDGSRTTCLMAYLSPYARTNNRSMRSAIEHLIEIATTDVGIPREALHLGGPPVDNVAIDIEGERTLRTLAGLSGIVGLVLAYLCFRNIRLTGMVLFVAIVSAGASLACVYYYGAIEVLMLGASTPRLGKVDAILMSMPAVVYVLALSGAIHLVNYYRDAVRQGGRRGAAERAVRMAVVPCGLASFTTAIGLASLASSDILPIEKFGVFSAIGVLMALGFLMTLLPVALHRFAPPIEATRHSNSSSLPGWARRITESICRHHAVVSVITLLAMGLFALGLPRMESSVQLLKLLDPKSDLVQDYTWMEQHLGNLVPMEVIVSVPKSLRRNVDEHPETDGQHYAMTTVQRLALARRIAGQIETLKPVSRTLSAATFSPEPLDSQSPSNRRTYDYIVSKAMDENRADLEEFLQWESTTSADESPRELWRLSARIAALEDIDYGEFVSQLKAVVEPVIGAYRLRDQVISILAKDDLQLTGARVCLVVPKDYSIEAYSVIDALLADLLKEATSTSGSRRSRGKLWVTSVERLSEESPSTQQRLATQQAVITLHQDLAGRLDKLGITNQFLDPSVELEGEQIAATYTGVVPLVYKTQRELLVSLQESLVLASLLIAIVLMVLLRSIGGGIASMVPNLFPLVVVFGALGWFGIPVDIGIMMTASVALGVAVDDTIHFVSWFRRGLEQGLSRYEAALESYERCATAMVQTTLIAGLGLAVFAFSTFTPTEQFGYLMVTILAAALVGDLILLPALLVGPVGALFPASITPAAKVSTPSDSASLSVPESSADSEPAIESRQDMEIENAEGSVDESSTANLISEADATPYSEQPSPERFQASHQTLSPANAALRTKLRRFRRDS